MASWQPTTVITVILAVALAGALLLLVRSRRNRITKVAGIALGLATFIAVVRYEIPFLFAFVVSRSALEEAATEWDFDDLNGLDIVLDGRPRRVGLFPVDRWGKGSDGGVYFRTSRSMVGFDVYSSGFALKPSRCGCPFGVAGYGAFPLSGDWYWFTASNDYFCQ